MDVPGIVEEALDGEDVAASIDLGGDDALFVTATRSIIYRSEGILSDESIETYTHEAEQLSVSEGRRKTRLTLSHPVEGTQEFTLPSGAADEAIPAILAGVLRENDVLEPGEEVIETYLFSELTLMITADRLVKHVGETVWDLEFEEFHYADVTGLSAEEGSVATQLVLEVDGRAQRIKTPSDRAREVRETLEDALRTYHGIRPDEEIDDALGPDDVEEEQAEGDDAQEGGAGGSMGLGETVDPLSAGDTSESGGSDPMEQPRELDDRRGAAPESGGAAEADDGAGADTAAQETAESDATGADSGADEAVDERAAGDAGSAQPAGGASEDAPGDSEPARAEAGDTAADSRGESRSEPTAESSSQAASRSTDDRSAAEDRSGAEGRSETAGVPSEDESAPADAAREEPTGESERANDVFQEAGFEPAEEDRTEALAEEIAQLRSAVQKQNKLLARQHKTIEKLVEELRRGR